MAKKIKVLGIHGLGDHRNSTWKQDWTNTLNQYFPGHDDIELEFDYISYDHIFEDVDLSAWESAKAVAKLAISGVTSPFGKKRGVLGRVSEKIKWTAGYVVAWVEDDEFQELTRELVLNKIAEYEPNIIAAHSLGSLVSYNALTHADVNSIPQDVLRKINYVTLGSQIGNPFVIRNLTPGRLEPLPFGYWYHLYNKEDSVFTSPIRLSDADNFRQVTTTFDIDGMADHSAVEYLKHNATIEEAWQPIANSPVNVTASRALRKIKKSSTRSVKQKEDRPENRALLVGINDYPNPADRLEGCVNDVYLMSSVLQECGFAPNEIRVCLDERATAQGVLERLEWLVDDMVAGDERVFYFSGHGTTIPSYGERDEPDRLCETLVPWDFDWSPETAISDDQIFSLYSQLPYDSRLVLIFDCCHSGGMHRDASSHVRGISPPDDIRHREIKWDIQSQMWVDRGFTRLDKDFSKNKQDCSAFFGHSGSVTRIGRASMLRGQTEEQYRAYKRKHRKTPFGPYLPLILEACAEDELASEYQHGVTSYGAFTYSITTILRTRARASRGRGITFEKLMQETKQQLEDLEFDQTPQILGPSKIMSSWVPWLRNVSR